LPDTPEFMFPVPSCVYDFIDSPFAVFVREKGIQEKEVAGCCYTGKRHAENTTQGLRNKAWGNLEGHDRSDNTEEGERAGDGKGVSVVASWGRGRGSGSGSSGAGRLAGSGAGGGGIARGVRGGGRGRGRGRRGRGRRRSRGRRGRSRARRSRRGRSRGRGRRGRATRGGAVSRRVNVDAEGLAGGGGERASGILVLLRGARLADAFRSSRLELGILAEAGKVGRGARGRSRRGGGDAAQSAGGGTLSRDGGGQDGDNGDGGVLHFAGWVGLIGKDEAFSESGMKYRS
jgi:hypothetical protein